MTIVILTCLCSVNSFIFGCLCIVLIFAAFEQKLSTESIIEHPIFYKEDTDWGEAHHSNKYIFCALFGSVVCYIPWVRKQHPIIRYFFTNAPTVVLFLFGEVIEQSIRLIVNSIFPHSDWFQGYSSETVSDIVLSDGIQAVASSTIIFLYVVCNVLPDMPSKLWVEDSMSGLTFRSILYSIFAVSTFIGTLNCYSMRVGFYAQFFLRFGILNLMCLLDIRKAKGAKLEFIGSWIMLHVYFIFIYCPSLVGLKTWDLISSNGIAMTLFVLLGLLKNTFQQ